MPEGHTLHRLARKLTRTFARREVASSSPQGRFELGATAVDGLVLRRAWARGKHLFVDFDGSDQSVHVHLGLFGKTSFKPSQQPVVGQVRWRLDDGQTVFDLRGPTACELFDPPQIDALLARLGPDPLDKAADPDRAWRRISRSKASIAKLLMDQSVVAGVGNVYRAEVLFRHALDPWTEGRRLDEATWMALWDDLVILMARGVRTGRIETLRPEHERTKRAGSRRSAARERPSYVYRRDGQDCRICGTTILTTEVAARNLFWCPSCQGVDTLRQ